MSQEMSHRKKWSPTPYLPTLAITVHCHPARTLFLLHSPPRAVLFLNEGCSSHQDKRHRKLQGEYHEAGTNSKGNSESVTLTPVVSVEGMGDVRLAAASTGVQFLVGGERTVAWTSKNYALIKVQLQIASRGRAESSSRWLDREMICSENFLQELVSCPLH